MGPGCVQLNQWQANEDVLMRAHNSEIFNVSGLYRGYLHVHANLPYHGYWFTHIPSQMVAFAPFMHILDWHFHSWPNDVIMTLDIIIVSFNHFWAF